MRVCLVLLVAVSAAVAQDKPLTPEQAAKAVLEAKDAAVLKALAGKDNPDPWLVADLLCVQGKFDEAVAFAKAAPRTDVEKLPAYVESRRGKTDDPERRKRLSAADALLAKKQFGAAVKAFGPAGSSPIEDVVGVRLAMGRGTALAALARLEEAQAAYTAGAEAAQRLGWLVRAATAHHEAGSVAYASGAFAAAGSEWECSLALLDQFAPPRAVALTLRNIGLANLYLGDFPKALSFHQRALSAQRALGDKAGVAKSLGSIGDVHYANGDYAKAVPFQERALASQEALGDKAKVATSLRAIGLSYYSSGNYVKALATYERGLAVCEELADKAGAASMLGDIGGVQARQGDYVTALSTYERALAAAQAIGDYVGTGRTLANISAVYGCMGDYAKALSASERALAAQDAVGDAKAVATTLGHIGIVYHRLGDYTKALASFDRALAAAGAVGDTVGAADALGNIGLLYGVLGDYAKALSFHERALAARHAAGDGAGAARTLGNIGRVYSSLRDFGNALSTYERALGAMKALGDKAAAAATLGDIGDVYKSMGKYDTALSFHQRALAAQQALGDQTSTAWTLERIGKVCRSMGDYTQALAFHERARAALDAIGDQGGAAFTLGSMGRIYYTLGENSQAISFARRAVVQLGSVVSGLGAEAGAGAREPLSFIYDVGARAALAERDPRELAFFLESGRAGALLEGLKARETLWSAEIPPILRAEELAARSAVAKATKLLRKLGDGVNRAEIRARRANLAVAQERVSAVIASIQRDAKAEASLVYPQAATLAEIRGALGAGDVLLLYGMFGPEACALVVSKADARIVTLGESARIEEAVAALQIDTNSSNPTVALAAVSKLVLDPVRLPKATTRLLVSPAGALGGVSFAVLAPDQTVSYIPSGTAYTLLREEQSRRGDGVLALGDPDYETNTDQRALTVMRGGVKLHRLPATRVEANSLGTRVLLGADATEAGFRSAIATKPRWRAVHLACHGLIDQERPALSSLALTPTAEDDGFLTTLEVFRMKIPADLVVLSACETGKGKIVKSEGIVGMMRAFMFAGAPRIICSLWSVDDEATRALMVKFYELWNPKDGKKGLATATALKKAQEYVASHEKWKHPYYWAAWQLWGLGD